MTPPLIGFFAKQQVLFSTLYNGFFFMSFVAILVSVISTSYYLYIIRVLCFSKEGLEEKFGLNFYSEYINKDVYSNSLFMNYFQSFFISIITLFILLFMLKPSLLLNMASFLAESSVFLS